MKGAKSKSGAKPANGRLSVKKTKAVKDPNKPKRPPSAFFVFLDDFRKQYKEKHPNNKSVAAVGKAAGIEWKAMSEVDKAPYVEKSEKRKKEYEKSLLAYNNKEPQAAEEESDKSKSELNDGDVEDSCEEGEGDD